MNLYLSSSIPALNTILKNTKSSINNDSYPRLLPTAIGTSEFRFFENIDCAKPCHVYSLIKQKITEKKMFLFGETILDKSIRVP